MVQGHWSLDTYIARFSSIIWQKTDMNKRKPLNGEYP